MRQSIIKRYVLQMAKIITINIIISFFFSFNELKIWNLLNQYNAAAMIINHSHKKIPYLPSSVALVNNGNDREPCIEC